MGLLERLREQFSEKRMRKSNFERCVGDTPGCQILHQTEEAGHVRYEIQVVNDVRLEQDFVRMLNTSHVRIDAIQTESRATYFEMTVN